MRLVSLQECHTFAAANSDCAGLRDVGRSAILFPSQLGACQGVNSSSCAADVLDADALGKLPPSKQMEEIAKFRDHQTTANRIRFREASTCPIDFASVQMESFLQRSEFRQKVDRMRDQMNAAAGFGEEGARPIASLAGRSFVFKDSADGEPLLAVLLGALRFSAERLSISHARA